MKVVERGYPYKYQHCTACGQRVELVHSITAGPNRKGNDEAIYRGVCRCGTRVILIQHAGDENRKEVVVEQTDYRTLPDYLKDLP